MAGIEILEYRMLLSATAAVPSFLLNRNASQVANAVSPGVGASPNATLGAAPFTPAQIRAAYGVNQITFNGTSGTGAGQTIAIVDAYNDPNIVADANSFSSQFGLTPFNGSGQPTFRVLNQTGGTSLPANASAGSWDIEEALDVEWAHSIAPNANIILFEANSASYTDLLQAVSTAAKTTGVSVVSMSWGGGEFTGENSFDSTFLTPSGHQGVTFVASSGDSGTPAGYPAYSPNVLAVGGTSLSINTDGSYVSESGWSNSTGAGGGGISQVESQPSYQTGKVNGTSSTRRTAPDVSMDADPNSGVYVLDSFDGGWWQVGGTSLAAPMWGGLIAVADQGRVLGGQSTLDGATQTLPMIYGLPSSDFHDIITGSNGTYAASSGYDLATGLGTPAANLLVPALAGFGSNPPPTVSAPSALNVNENGAVTFSAAGGDPITVADAAAGTNSDSLTLSVTNGTLNLGSTSGVTITAGANGSASMTLSGTLANLNAALNGLVYTPKSGFSGPDSLKVSIADPNDSLGASTSVGLTVVAPTPPVVSAPASASLTQNSSIVFSTARGNAITLTDAFAGANTETLTLSATDGTLVLASTFGVTVSSGANGSSSMTLTGTLANLNAAINGLTYTAGSGFTGSDSLKVALSDSGDNLSGSASVGLSITAASQPPTVTAPAAATGTENSSVVFSAAAGDAITVTDVAAGGSAERLTLNSTHGTLRLATTTGLTFLAGSNRSTSMTVSGTIANLNAALNGLTYTPKFRFVGVGSIKVAIQDVGDNLSASATISVTIKAPGAAVRRAESGTQVGAPEPVRIVELHQDADPSQSSATILFGSPNGSFTVVMPVPIRDGGTQADEMLPQHNLTAGELRIAIGAGDVVDGDRSDSGGTSGEASGKSGGPTGDAADPTVIDEIMQWLGLNAAIEVLGGAG